MIDEDQFTGVLCLTICILLATTTLVSCIRDTKPEIEDKPVVVQYIKVPYDCGKPPGVAQIEIAQITWKLFTIGDETYFSLTTENYTKMAEGVANVLLASRQLRAQRDFYADCVTDSMAEIDVTP